MPGVSSVQITFHEDKAPEHHAMPPGGFRLAIVNAHSLGAASGTGETAASPDPRLSTARRQRERGNSGQGLALQPFQEGAARGGDVAHPVEHAGAAQCRHRVAAAGDAAQRTCPVAVATALANAVVAASNGGVLNAPSGPFQTSVRHAPEMTDQRVHRRRTNIQDHRIGRHCLDRHGLRRHTRLQFRRPPPHRSAAAPRSPPPSPARGFRARSHASRLPAASGRPHGLVRPGTCSPSHRRSPARSPWQ